MDLGLLEEFRFDWELAGKAARTVDDYIAALRLFLAESPEPNLGSAKAWVASTSYASVRRKRAQAIRAFGRWGEGTGEVVFPWWKEVPLVGEEQRPQPCLRSLVLVDVGVGVAVERALLATVNH